MPRLRESVLFVAILCLFFGLAVVAVEAGKPTKVEICTNGRDDDKDGAIDCDDDDCDQDPACASCTVTEDPEVSCTDGLDNDCDGLTDAADSDCPPVDPSECLLEFTAVLDSLSGAAAVQSDGLTCGSFDYCDGQDKVFIGCKDPGFRFDTQYTKPNRKDTARTIQLDLTMFDNRGDCPPGTGKSCVPDWFEGNAPYITMDMRFQLPPGGLNLCDLCIEGVGGCTCSCHQGAEGDDDCGPGESSCGKVGLHITFPVTDATYDQMKLDYGMRYGGIPLFCGSEPVVVTRISATEWTIEGTTACLSDGGMTGPHIEQGTDPITGFPIYAKEAPFKLTLTRIQ